MRMLVIGLTVVLSLTGCGTGGGPDNPFVGETRQANSIQIRVQNQNFNEASLYAVAGTRIRIGRIGGNEARTYSINWSGVRDLRVEIDILAGEEFLTNRLSVSPGETLILVIENPVYRSLLRR